MRRRRALWTSLVLAVLVAVGVVVQIYLIAAWIFGEGGALSAHEDLGNVVHPLEVLVFIAGLAAWWGTWRNVVWSFALPLVGTIQVVLVGDLGKPGNGYVHGLHGGLAIFVAALALVIAQREANALGLRAAAQ
jgi:hypothetical protein